VSPLIREMNFEPQKEKLVEGLQAAVQLWEWFCGNKGAIMGERSRRFDVWTFGRKSLSGESRTILNAAATTRLSRRRDLAG